MPFASRTDMGFAARAAWTLIALYRYTLGYVMGGNCRFYPSCSVYGQEAFDKHGFWRGLGLTLARLGRCHPWHPGGLDGVPARCTDGPTMSQHSRQI